MKTYKKILLLLLGILIIAGTTYAWKAGGGVKWIGEVDQSNRFADYSTNTSDYGTGYYLDTYTGLKWQAQSGPVGLKWAIDNSYTEPVWNGNNYDYPSGRSSIDYPAFQYCESIGDGHWRLPTKNELFSIVTDISSQKNDSGKYTKLPSITQYNYWSSTAFAYYSYAAGYGHFGYGHVGGYSKIDTTRYTICIHD